ncbi:MAG: cyclodeaminase [Acidimicrobiia bacterium]|nr:cyclodeaminase [Acidimicrobiia bacterium]
MPTELSVLTETQIRGLVGFGEEELTTIESVYPLIADGSAVMPPIMRLDVEDHNGEVDIKTAYLPGHPGIAVKVSAGFFDNPKKGLPSLGGFMMVLDSETGVPAAALFDNGYLTDLRTALAGAVAARHLANPEASRVAVLGAGVQARLQVEALLLVSEIETVSVWARRQEQAEDLAGVLSSELDLDASEFGTVEGTLADADIVVTTTPATDGVLEERHLHRGLHVTAIGSDAEHKRELGPGVLATADLVVVDSVAQSLRLGEARAAIAEGFDESTLVQLGEVVSGTHPGRTSSEQVTVCDLTGTGAQDTAIAGLVVEWATKAGVGDVVVT